MSHIESSHGSWPPQDDRSFVTTVSVSGLDACPRWYRDRIIPTIQANRTETNENLLGSLHLGTNIHKIYIKNFARRYPRPRRRHPHPSFPDNSRAWRNEVRSRARMKGRRSEALAVPGCPFRPHPNSVFGPSATVPTVPNFVPTTKPDHVLPSVGIPLLTSRKAASGAGLVAFGHTS